VNSAAPVSFEPRDAVSGEPVPCLVRRLIIAGYTGRDQEQVRRHVRELAGLGVPPPDTIPAFYEVPPSLLSWSDPIETEGEETSGEGELVLFSTARGWYVGLGSDHTDRSLERSSISASKSACPKPVSTAVLPAAAVTGRWDRLTLRSHADGIPYQDAPLAELLPLDDVVDSCRRSTSGSLDDVALFLGTVPLLDGEFRYSRAFRTELWDGGRQLLSCSYHVIRRS
jgi:hypothetical protein